MEKNAKICDVCEKKIAHVSCPLCQKDVCSDCEMVSDFGTSEKTIFHLITCEGCHYALGVVEFDSDMTEELVKGFVSSVQNIMTAAFLSDDKLSEKVKQRKEFQKIKRDAFNGIRALQVGRNVVSAQELPDVDKHFKLWKTRNRAPYSGKRYGFASPTGKFQTINFVPQGQRLSKGQITRGGQKI